MAVVITLILVPLVVVLFVGFQLSPADAKFEWWTSLIGLYGVLFSLITFVVATVISTRQDVLITDISERITTQFLGMFPHYLPKIIELLTTASKANGSEVAVATDYPGYGHYSAARAFESYRGALRECARGSNFRFVFLAPSAWRRLQEKQFHNWAADHTHGEGLRTFDDFMAGRKNDKKPTTLDELLPLLEKSNNATIENMDWRPEDVRFKTSATPLSIHVWIVRDPVSTPGHFAGAAVFTFPVYNSDAIEYGFYTEDPKLLKALYQTFENVHRESLLYREPVAPPRPSSLGAESRQQG
nr:hypothetical protein [Kofleriaceae bacterium]